MVIYQFNRMEFAMRKGMKTFNCFPFYYLITTRRLSINSIFFPPSLREAKTSWDKGKWFDLLASLGMRICSLLLPSPPSVVALTSIK